MASPCLTASSARHGDAVKAAEKLGFPVTLKVSSAAIAHKTEAGGVALNLKTADEVERRGRAHGEASPMKCSSSAW